MWGQYRFRFRPDYDVLPWFTVVNVSAVCLFFCIVGHWSHSAVMYVSVQMGKASDCSLSENLFKNRLPHYIMAKT